MYKNLAVFGINKADEIQKQFSEIKSWYVGGHSLGGSMAFLYASRYSEMINGILIFGTYSGTDISGLNIKVRRINGLEDGIFPPEKIENHKVELPENAEIIFIKGMNHADIGDYGFQSGDNSSKLTYESLINHLVISTKNFFE